MKLKEKFILYSNVNKTPPKPEKSIDTFSSIFEKIPSSFLKENPIIGLASNRKRKPFITIAKKYKKPEYMGLDKQMEDKEKKVISEINDLKEIIYEHYKEKDKQMNSYNRMRNESRQFSKFYNKIKNEKNKFNTGTYLDYKPFINISNKYISRNMKVPNLSLDHNIFSGNPLILDGSELRDYIIYNLGNKSKSIKFLNKIDDLLTRKKMGNFKLNAQEMENLENIKNNENSKGYLQPEIEIKKLKKDIRSTRNSYKHLGGFESFFEALNKRKRNIEKFSKLKNKSAGNIFNNINNNILNSNNNLDSNNNSINNSNSYANPKNQRKYSCYSKYKNLALNNSDITSTTGVNMTIKPSSLETYREFNSHDNANSSLARQHEHKKIKLSPIESSFLFSSKNNESHKKKIVYKRINNKNNLKLALKSFHFNSPKDKISSKIKKIEIPRIKDISKLNLQELNKKENFSILSEKDKNLTHYSGNDELFQINKEIENLNKNEENKNNLNFKEDKRNLDLENGTQKIKIKEDKNETNKIEIKEDGNGEKINSVENLFEIVKRKGINLKNNKKEIESYAISKGKELKALLDKKDTYFSIYRLKQKALERNLILEELIFRNGNHVKVLFKKKEKKFLEKNKNFLDGIINQEKKIKEIIIENKFQ